MKDKQIDHREASLLKRVTKFCKGTSWLLYVLSFWMLRIYHTKLIKYFFFVVFCQVKKPKNFITNIVKINILEMNIYASRDIHPSHRLNKDTYRLWQDIKYFFFYKAFFFFYSNHKLFLFWQCQYIATENRSILHRYLTNLVGSVFLV